MKKLITLGIALAMLATMILPVAAFAADNAAGQSASTNSLSSNSIAINAQNGTSAVTTITFPPGNPTDTISTPYNDIDTVDSSQNCVSGGTGKPVVTLKNTDLSNSYIIWYNISAWDVANVVASEKYLIVASGAGCNTETAITNTATIGSATVTVGPTTITADTTMDLYLKITLGSASGKTAASTLTILGETP
jgi:hypothetical protein